MTCERYGDTDMAEQYLAGALPQEEEVAFEQHFLGCDDCLETIRGMEDIRDELAAARAGAAGAAGATVGAATAASSPGAASPAVVVAAAVAAPPAVAGRGHVIPMPDRRRHEAAPEAALPAFDGQASAGDKRTAGPQTGEVARPAAFGSETLTSETLVAAASGAAGTHGAAHAAASRPSAADVDGMTPHQHADDRQHAGGRRLAPWIWVAAALAASVVIGGMWMRVQAPAPHDATVAGNGTAPSRLTAPAQTTATNRPQPPPPSPPPAPASQVPARAQLLATLAMVVPPPYVSVPVRTESAPASQVFERAMTRYRARDYRGATEGLRALVAKEPDAVHAQFFLGVSALMDRQTDVAVAALKRVAVSGVTPFADEAHFYLAKAALQREDLATAERELARAVTLDAGPENEARTLLSQVRTLRAAPAK